MRIPNPIELGMPEKFQSWRANQEDAISKATYRSKRVVAISAPTGHGKELDCVAIAKLSNEPTCIVTGSRGLQDQYQETYKSIGMTDLRGRNNYTCSLRQDEHFSCAEGYNARCPYKGTHMCPSSQAEMRASISNLVVTNYDKWTANRKFGQGLNHIKHVIFDEAHFAPEALARAMQVTLNPKEIEETLGVDFLGGTECEEFREWKTWAIACRAVAENALLDARRKITSTVNPKTAWIKHYCHMRNLVRRLATVATAAAKDWVVDQVDNGFQFDPIRPGRYAEAALLLHVPKITMVSATITPKTLFMTGIGRANFDFYEYDSSFDPKRGPIYYVPTLKVKGLGQDLSPIWALLDRIIAKRTGQLGRNGIVHTISYDRQQDLYNQSRFFERMITNDRGEAPTEKIELFKSQQGMILVSPSVGTGYDFPDEECRYQFVAKVPFEPPSKIQAARQEADSEYVYYRAWQYLVQAFGRDVRSETDWSERFIGDKQMSWMRSKYGHLAPKSFHAVFKTVDILPQPLHL